MAMAMALKFVRMNEYCIFIHFTRELLSRSSWSVNTLFRDTPRVVSYRYAHVTDQEPTFIYQLILHNMKYVYPFSIEAHTAPAFVWF